MQSAFIERARHARACIAKVPARDKSDYLNAVKGLPAEIRLIGLGQALATLRANDKKGRKLLYEHLEDWIFDSKSGRIYASRPAQPPYLLHALIGDGPPGQTVSSVQGNYRLAVAEADAYLAILKRFAEVFLTDEKPSPPGTSQRADAQ